MTTNHDKSSLFVLNAEQPLRSLALSEDMLEALADSEVVNPPGVLSVVCEWMDLQDAHSFSIQVSNTKTCYLTSSSSRLSCLEQLPSLVAWAASNEAHCCLDINEQGSDLRIEFSRSGEKIRHYCIEDHWNTAVRTEGDWENSSSSLTNCCVAIAKEVARIAIAMNSNIEKLPAFRDWCVKCGFELT